MMKLEEKNQHQLELCLSTRCNLCRRSCPVYCSSGMEFDSPRAKIELINEALEGRVKEEEVLNTVSKCTGCRRCKKTCPNSVDVPAIIQDFKNLSRKKTSSDHIFLKSIGYPQKAIENLITSGNPFGKPRENIDIKNMDPEEDWLFFPGCVTSEYAVGVLDNIYRILNQLKIKFFVFNACCFAPLRNYGFNNEEIRKIFNNRYEGIKKFKIITPCPGCVNELKTNHDVEAYHITEVINKKITKLRLSQDLEVVVDDPCKLGRYQNIYEPPRNTLKNIRGLHIMEFEKNRENSLCCGGGGGLPIIDPQKSADIARRLLESRPNKKGIIVTTCPMCYIHLSKQSNKEVKYITDLIADSIH